MKILNKTNTMVTITDTSGIDHFIPPSNYPVDVSGTFNNSQLPNTVKLIEDSPDQDTTIDNLGE